MTAINKTKVILFGGATGDTGKYSITGDTYSFDVVTNTWTKLSGISGYYPSPRAAHAASVVEAFQMVVYGGATGGGSLASDDLYLLDMRLGEDQATWMTVPVVGSTPGRRYGHTLIYIKPHLIVFGGNTGSEPVNDVWSLNVEKAPFSWARLEIKSDQPPVRVYHSASLCMTGSAMGMMVIFGGRTADQSALNDTWGLRRHRDGRWDWVRAPYKAGAEQPLPRYQHSTLFIGSTMIVIGGRTNQVGEIVPLEAYDTENSEWYKFPAVTRFRHASWNFDADIFIHGGFEHDTPNIPTDAIVKVDSIRLFFRNEHLLPKYLADPQVKTLSSSANEPTRPLPRIPRTNNKTPEIRLASQVFVTIAGEANSDFGELVRKVSIDRLQEEGKRLNVKALPPGVSKGSSQQTEAIYTVFLTQLLRTSDWGHINDMSFNIRKEMILALIEECENILKSEPNLIRIRPPVKIFGNLHGQYIDLLRLFELWGEPSDEPVHGDIECFDYLFLGDYIDRGTRSLEVICLLMALKVKYPDQIYLLRGHHEDKFVNSVYGFADECRNRLGEDPLDPRSVFSRMNKMFEYLPLAAVIEDKVLCVHGGIGNFWRLLEDIDALPKPIEISHEVINSQQQILYDALWSDPCENERETGCKVNTFRDTMGQGNIVKFGGDRLQRFLLENSLGMIIRSHECVMEGFDRSTTGDCLTIFSATDYCGKYKNPAAILTINRNTAIVPKLIYPLNSTSSNWIDNEDSLKKRPATPPRWKTRG